MPTLRQLLPAARVELLDPRPQKPSYRQLLSYAVARINHAHNQLNNTHRAWSVGDTTLSVIQGQEEYALGAQNVGKILDVTTYDPNNSGWIESQVSFFDLTQMANDWGVSRDGGSGIWTADGGPHTAVRMAFLRKGGSGQVYVRVKPIPQTNADYRITFAVGGWATEAALDDSPLLSEHHHMFTTGIALDGVVAAEWWDDEKENRIRRVELGQSLSRRLQSYEEEFKTSIASVTAPRMSMRILPCSIDA